MLRVLIPPTVGDLRQAKQEEGTNIDALDAGERGAITVPSLFTLVKGADGNCRKNWQRTMNGSLRLPHCLLVLVQRALPMYLLFTCWNLGVHVREPEPSLHTFQFLLGRAGYGSDILDLTASSPHWDTWTRIGVALEKLGVARGRSWLNSVEAVLSPRSALTWTFPVLLTLQPEVYHQGMLLMHDPTSQESPRSLPPISNIDHISILVS